MRKILLYIVIATSLCACHNYSETDATRMCGVAVKGTPWELAATVADHGDGTFVPESVLVFSGKAYIKGWYNSNVTAQPYTAEPFDDGYLPAEIVCDVENGSVSHALLYCEILDRQK